MVTSKASCTHRRSICRSRAILNCQLSVPDRKSSVDSLPGMEAAGALVAQALRRAPRSRDTTSLHGELRPAAKCCWQPREHRPHGSAVGHPHPLKR